MPLQRLINDINKLSEAYDLPRVCECPEAMLPWAMEINGLSDVQKGAAGVILAIYMGVSQSTDGRQALADLGFKPFFEQVKSP